MYGIKDSDGSFLSIFSILEGILLLLFGVFYIVLLFMPRFSSLFGEFKSKFLDKNRFTNKVYNYLMIQKLVLGLILGFMIEIP